MAGIPRNKMVVRKVRMVHWRDRKGAVDYIVSQMLQGKSFERSFAEMKKVANNKGFLYKNGHFELMSSYSYTILRNQCNKRFKELKENEGA